MAALLYLRARTADPTHSEALRGSIATLARQTAAEGAADAFGASGPMQWGTVGARFTRSGLFSVQRCLAGSEPDCAQALDNVHSALGRNALQISFIGGLPGVTRAHEHCFHQWLAALQASPYCWPGSVAGGPNPAPEKEDVSFPAAWPRPIWGYFGDPRFPRDSATPPEWRYTDNDSWSTNEVSIDWQATALYSLHFARWMAMRDQPSSSR